MRNKIFIILIVLILIVGAFGYWVYRDNIYSKEVLRVEILGPERVVAGEEIEYRVTLQNTGNVYLEEPQLIFEFPGSAVPLGGRSSRTVIESDEFEGAIYPGQLKTFSFRGKLFGQEGEMQEARAIVSYRPKNLQAGYVSRTSHLTTIGEVPITFEFDLPSGSGPGQELSFSLNYFSSVNHPLTDLEIKINYPAGFEIKSIEPKGVSDHEWRMPLLNRAQGGRINIVGDLKGEKGEVKVFQAEMGTWKGGEFITLKQTSKQVNIVEPSLHISQNINNSRDYVARPGELLHYEIVFRNMGDSPLKHLFLATKLSSPLYDLETIRTPEGQAQIADNSILWDWRDVSELQFLEPGEEGAVEFWIELKEGVKGISRPRLENEVILSQTRKNFTTKVHAKTELTQLAYVDDEIFGSQGNLPPEAGQDSYFTIIWRIKNYFNSLKDVEVRASLPEHIRFTGEALPKEIGFDSSSREIVWPIGELEANKGVEETFQAVFQIRLQPTNDQLDEFPVLINSARLTGKDEWTGDELTATTSPLTTEGFGEKGRVQ